MFSRVIVSPFGRKRFLDVVKADGAGRNGSSSLFHFCQCPVAGIAFFRKGYRLLVFSKFAPLFFYPLGISILLAILALGCAIRGNRRFAIGGASAALALLTLFSLPITDHVLIRSLESPFNQQESPTACSTIVLLCGAEVPNIPPRAYPELNHAADRLFHAARLLKQGFGSRIIVTGGKIAFLSDFESSPAGQTAFLLRDSFGIDSQDVIVEPLARNTHEHTPHVARILDSLNLPREIILVTSASHMKRSIGVFRKAGFTVHPAPADFKANSQFHPGILKFIPQAIALQRSTQALHEYYGMLAYRVLGWL